MEAEKDRPLPESMWAIHGKDFGFYVGTQLSEKEMIREHCYKLGKTWEKLQAKGDRCLKVMIYPCDKLE